MAETHAQAMQAHRRRPRCNRSMDDVAWGAIGTVAMNVFAIVAGVMVLIHAVAAWQRPRLAVFVSGILWLLYAYYEHLVATGVLCDANCNIRVDLLLFFPILGLATFWAYRSYMGRPGPQKAVGTVLAAIGLFVVALLAESFGYRTLAGAVIVGLLAAALIYGVKAKRR